MKIVIVAVALIICSFASANESSRMKLPQAGTVILTPTYGEKANRYDLFFEGSDGGSALLYTHEVSKTTANSPLGEWCALIACDESDQSILVLMELNELDILFVHYDREEKETTAERVLAPVFSQMVEGVRLAPPNRILGKIRGRGSQSWTVVGRLLIDENGEEYDPRPGNSVLNTKVVDEPASKASPNPTGGGNEEPPKEAPPSSVKKEDVTSAAPSEESASSIPWLVVGALVAAALGVLWILLKGRKRDPAE